MVGASWWGGPACRTSYLQSQRWTENRAKQTRRDVSDEGSEEIIAVMEPPTADEEALVFRHDDNIRTWLAQSSDCLASE